MSEDLSLFGDDEQSAPVEPPRAPTPIADWQIDLLRKALNARGLTTMEERQQAIESAAGRTVDVPALSHPRRGDAGAVTPRSGGAGGAKRDVTVGRP